MWLTSWDLVWLTWSRETFPVGDHHNSVSAHVGVWSVAPVHFLLIRMFSSSDLGEGEETPASVTTTGGWEPGPTFTQVRLSPGNIRVSWQKPHVWNWMFSINIIYKTRSCWRKFCLETSSAITAVERDRTGRPGRQSLVMIAWWSRCQSGHTRSSELRELWPEMRSFYDFILKCILEYFVHFF